jgi:hypothetical protein
MEANQIAVVVLALVALILAIIDEAKAQWQSTTHWAVILVAVSVLVLTLDPL